ncbi:restriction endonuclease [Dolosigranulum pigrum]|uniref:Eco57I restriction-modification methylase domain-containing protein n=1 Tax=Dolosigranulum pigrum TaxID=29394 RepID=UPI0019196C5F|nr:Eco57I restriction-modification methylase domain-containing protein [Dolosigranulum pigrum]QTJ41404.1 restriction endonuclease [Dolosigranulum pigrum]QTJ54574.1 restriction endonuclease [Dolosigranulum pigrum]
MSCKTEIKPFEQQHITIYAYTLPEVPKHNGYIKIGDTRRNVQVRINEQIGTSGLKPNILWDKVARHKSGEWFRDYDLHRFLELHNIKRENFGTTAREWFFFNGHPERAEELTEKFIHRDFSEAQRNKIIQPDYILRKEQEKAVSVTHQYFQKHPNSHFLWNAKPRFGKTLSTYDLVRRLEAENVLIVTNRPAVANSWYDDFEKFIAHKEDNLYFVSDTDGLTHKAISHSNYKDIVVDAEDRPVRQISFVSLQDLKGAKFAGGDYDKLNFIPMIEWDLLVIDEAHEGVDTAKTKQAFDKITRKHTLHLSGTPFKAIAHGKFSEEAIYNWSYLDEQQAKKNWDYAKEEDNPYEKLPELSLFTYQMSQMVTEQLEQGTAIMNEVNRDFAFDLNEFFSADDDGKFKHQESVKKFLDNLSSGKFPFASGEYKNELNHTFWLLPWVNSCKALKKLLDKHPVFKEYEVILAAGDGKPLVEENAEQLEGEANNFPANEKSFDRVTKAIKEHEKTITLSCGQLTTGVTIPAWTGIMMLNNITSPELYFQAAFRVQNPYEKQDGDKLLRKERAYIFDFAPDRTLQLFADFAIGLVNDPATFTNEQQREKVKELLNFFPVIAEDEDGTMKELNTDEVMTIPNKIKSSEVVSRGFMSNLLFDNIGRIFNAPNEVRDILNKIKPEENGQSGKKRDIKPRNPSVNEHGNVDIPNKVVINESKKLFGRKIFMNFDIDRDIEVTKQLEQIISKLKSWLETKEDKERWKEEEITQVKDIFRKILGSKLQVEQDRYKQATNEVNQEYKTKVKQLEREANKKIAISSEDQYETIFEEFKNKKNTLEKEKRVKQEKINYTYDENIQKVTQETAHESVKIQMEKQETKKKKEEEHDVRDHLRGFARTIPAFLMAYGNKETKLRNFEENIDPTTFEELTSITIDEFQKLRDGFIYETEEGETKEFKGFFNAAVFDAAVKAFFEKKEELSDYFDDSVSEDIFDYIPNQETNQIFTPKWVVEMMVDKLEEENPGIFSDPSQTFADLYVKSGMYITEIVKRLNEGLKDEIPDRSQRLKHIFENQVYAIAPSNIIYNIAKNYIFGVTEDVNTANLKELDLSPIVQEGDAQDAIDNVFGRDKMKFDVVIGNPPFQEETKDTSDKQIYYLFLDEGYRLASKACFVTKGAFLFNAGGTPKKWNKKMLNDEHIKVMYYEQDASKVFPGTGFKGGVTVTYRDKNKKFGKIGTFTHYKELNSILQKVINTDNFESIQKIIYLQNKFDLDKLYDDYPEFKKLIGSNGREKRLTTNIFSTLPLFNNNKCNEEITVKIFGLIDNNRVIKLLPKKYLNSSINLDKFKVLLPKSNGTGNLGESLSTPLIADPGVGFTQSFISFGNFNNENYAINILKYLKSKFARTLLGSLKITQDNNRSKWKYVPMQDFTEQSDIDWTQSIKNIDKQLYKKYNLNQEEIDFIEEKVQAMD